MQESRTLRVDADDLGLASRLVAPARGRLPESAKTGAKR